ncbi:MAG: hypothetical protein M1272_00265 [Firmicutes bacterium]|nr:hypothetical protein [Bacillota bacterium]
MRWKWLGVGWGFAGALVVAMPHVDAAGVSDRLTIRNDSAGPYYTPSTWTWPAGQTVKLTIVSHDDGASPLKDRSPETRVLGTVHRQEWVDGKPVGRVAGGRISHTLTIPGLRVNLPIPAARTGGTVTVVAWVRVSHPGTYAWYCEAPCGTGARGDGGPMATPGLMQGVLHVAEN